jgi:hypothetical protein
MLVALAEWLFLWLASYGNLLGFRFQCFESGPVYLRLAHSCLANEK